MLIYVSADLEGISGVTRREDLLPPGMDYPAARRWLTLEVNAAVAGARAAGATDFVVEENHGAELLCNLDLDLIDPEVDVVRGFPRGTTTTISALTVECDAVFLVGHHACVGDPRGMMAHTISGVFTDVRLDGRTVGEGELIALAAAEVGVPTVLVTGDDVTAHQLSAVVPGIETAVVKTALSGNGGRLMPPVRGAAMVQAAAERAIRRLQDGHRPMAIPRGPSVLEIELSPLVDDLHALLADVPGLALSGRTLTGKPETAADAWRLGVHAASVVMPALVAQYRKG